jgi:thiamine-phosphate pyrophosphorylase
MNRTARGCWRGSHPLLPFASCLQYRNKRADAGLREQQAVALRGLCRGAGVPLIINDDASLAAKIGADGVHLGEHDGDIVAARALLGDGAIIGVSCYDELLRAEIAARTGADYIAFGAFFPSPTKPNARRAAPALLQAAARLGLPRVAIGGITPDNARPLIAAGADLIAVISWRVRRRPIRWPRRRRIARASPHPIPRLSRAGGRGRTRAFPMNTDRSQALFARAQPLMPGGVNSPVRCVQVGRRRAVFRAARGRRSPGRCRRQSLHRLRRFMGADDRRPQPSRRCSMR